MSLPVSRRWVANERRKVWQVARLGMPAARTARRTASWITVSCRWCRRVCPVSRSWYSRVAGNTHCQAQAVPADGSFRASARQLDPAGALGDIGLVLVAHALEMRREVGLHGGGKHRGAV